MLLDLDDTQSSDYKLPIATELEFLIEPIDLPDFNRLEDAAQSCVILRTLFFTQMSRYQDIADFINALTNTVLEQSKGRLQYNIHDYHPHVCANCFSYYGHCIGGTVQIYCGLCSTGYGNTELAKRFTSLGDILPTFYGHAGFLFHYNTQIGTYEQKMAWNRIFLARLIYKFFARSYQG